MAGLQDLKKAREHNTRNNGTLSWAGGYSKKQWDRQWYGALQAKCSGEDGGQREEEKRDRQQGSDGERNSSN